MVLRLGLQLMPFMAGQAFRVNQVMARHAQPAHAGGCTAQHPPHHLRPPSCPSATAPRRCGGGPATCGRATLALWTTRATPTSASTAAPTPRCRGGWRAELGTCWGHEMSNALHRPPALPAVPCIRASPARCCLFAIVSPPPSLLLRSLTPTPLRRTTSSGRWRSRQAQHSCPGGG